MGLKRSLAELDVHGSVSWGEMLCFLLVLQAKSLPSFLHGCVLTFYSFYWAGRKNVKTLGFFPKACSDVRYLWMLQLCLRCRCCLQMAHGGNLSPTLPRVTWVPVDLQTPALLPHQPLYSSISQGCGGALSTIVCDFTLVRLES